MTRRFKLILSLLIAALAALGVATLEAGEPGVNATVDFANLTRDWDGFGVNYVELAQSPDYDEWPQEYGGFSLLTEEERQEILDMIFGDDGLKPGIVKMFFDPFQQEEPGGPFDHERTTRWMRYFVREGLATPGTAFRVSADGDYEVLAGYWFYKQVSRAGQAGMSVVPVTTTSDSGIELIGFGSNGTQHPDAVVVLNTIRWGSQLVRVRVLGNDSASFRGYLTTGDLEKKYEDQGSFEVEDGYVKFDLPARSALTLYAE